MIQAERSEVKEVVPFDVDVAHLLPAEADIIQDDITRVPDDATQEKPEHEQM